MARILIVEDEEKIARFVTLELEHEGYQVEHAADGRTAVDLALERDYDLILLDVLLPQLNGMEVLRRVRKHKDVPVIMVTSRESEADEVLSMSYGADDYIVKPYNPTILLLRIHAIFRRLKGATGQLNCGGMEIMPQKGVIKYHNGEKEMLLTKNEMTIFAYLLSRRETIVSRDELMTELWNNEEYINDNALTVNISRLRGKLKEMGCDGMIETRKGQGYILREGDKE